MLYFAISNIGLAIMMIVVYVRYSKLAITSGHQIKDLKQKIVNEVSEKNALQEQLFTETQGDNERIAQALKEVDEIRKEKEYEMKLRLEADKQIQLALQRTEEVQKRMQDWRIIQDAVMKDAKEEIANLADTISEKMSENYRRAGESNQNLLTEISHNIQQLSSGEKEAVSEMKARKTTRTTSVNDLSNSLIDELVDTMRASGHIANKDFFLSQNFDVNKAKLFLCEIAFINEGKLHIIDFKSNRYLDEYQKDKDANSLQLRFKKYLAYLSNAKYSDSVQKALASSNVAFNDIEIVIALSSESEIALLQKIGCYESALDMGFVVADFDMLNNIIL